MSCETWRLFRILSEFIDGFDIMSEIGAGITGFGSARVRAGENYYDLAVECGRKVRDQHFAVIAGGGHLGRGVSQTLFRKQKAHAL